MKFVRIRLGNENKFYEANSATQITFLDSVFYKCSQNRYQQFYKISNLLIMIAKFFLTYIAKIAKRFQAVRRQVIGIPSLSQNTNFPRNLKFPNLFRNFHKMFVKFPVILTQNFSNISYKISIVIVQSEHIPTISLNNLKTIRKIYNRSFFLNLFLFT